MSATVSESRLASCQRTWSAVFESGGVTRFGAGSAVFTLHAATEATRDRILSADRYCAAMAYVRGDIGEGGLRAAHRFKNRRIARGAILREPGGVVRSLSRAGTAKRLVTLLATLGATMSVCSQAIGQHSLDEILNKGVVLPKKKASAPAKESPAPPANPPRRATPAGVGRSTSLTPAGLKMDLPPGWHARWAQNGAVVATGQNDLTVVIAPVPDAGDTRVGDWLQNRGAAALAPYIKSPVITGIYPSRAGPQAALASLEFGDPQAPGRANLLCFVSGGVGKLYAIAGPKAIFLRERAELVGILQSLSFTGFIRFQDPKEGAFSVDVPAGWNIEGGTVRKSPLDTRSFVWATSPDGSTVIRLRDPAFSSVPNRRRCEPGPEFARQYAAKLAGDLQGSSLQLTSVTTRQDLSSSKAMPGVGRSQTTGGEAAFTCIRNGRTCAGKVIAATSAASLSPGLTMWCVDYLVSYLTAQESMGVADRTLQQMLESVRCPERFGMQPPAARSASQIIKGTAQYTAKVFDRVHGKREKPEERTRQNPDFTELEQIR